MKEKEIVIINELKKLNYQFKNKPLLVGGMAMEVYKLREHGDDIDFIISKEDYYGLKEIYPDNIKDVWGDFGLQVNNLELFRSMYKFDYSYYANGAIDSGEIKIVSIDMLFRMKVYAIPAGEKHAKDIELIKNHYNMMQKKEYVNYMNNHIDRYLKVNNGIIDNVNYSDEE
jgi:hypothetical protein